MKRLFCESCGSINIIRTDDYYVCQNCGTKYINDSASSVLDLSKLKDNALINARRARSNRDWDETERYYDAVEMYSPQNAEAVFYSAYAKARRALMTADPGAEDALRIFAKDIDFIDKTYVPADIDAHISLLEGMSKDIRALCKYKFDYDSNIITLFKAIHTVFYFMLAHIIANMQADRKLTRLYSMQVKHLEAMLAYGAYGEERSEILEKLEAIHQDWKRIDPMHSYSRTHMSNDLSAANGYGFKDYLRFIFISLAILIISLSAMSGSIELFSYGLLILVIAFILWLWN